jgi:1,4-alpha-glucan branching enzyme
MSSPPAKPGALGSFCLVLHGHLPWVLHHGRWPHGEDWLFEAAAETWLPLLEVLDACAAEDLRPAWTVGMTPILLEQLRQDRFKTGFSDYLAHLVTQARRDALAFEARDEALLAALAASHVDHHRRQREQFDAIQQDIPEAVFSHVRAGRIELLSSNATHGYHPLLLHDASARGQLRAGLATTERHFGARPAGIWLPECAYRPPGPWMPAALHTDVRWRAGVASLAASVGVRYFVVDTHLVRDSRSEAVIEGDTVHKVDWSQAAWDHQRAWGSELEPHRVWEDGHATEVTVFARCPEVSELVWSGEVGFPGDGRYLEFHKRHGTRGLRYWRVTGRVDLGAKEPYFPREAHAAVREHAARFVDIVRERIRAHHIGLGRAGVVCAPFDAELFGHWWHEGPAFLLEVARLLAADPQVAAATLGEVVAREPADKAASIPEGSWGAGGDHRVWQNDEMRLYWEVAYRAEDRFLGLWHEVPWQTDPVCASLLRDAARELLLLQASDWPFVISTRGAVDYGLRRVFEHAAVFDDLCNGVLDAAADPPRPPDLAVTEAERRVALFDGVFPDVDLAWWGP